MGLSNKQTIGQNRRPPAGSQKVLLLILFAGIAVFAGCSVGLYYYLKPTVFRIAVGPPGSDDQKLVQVMADTFTQKRNAIRLSVTVTPGALESIAAFERHEVDLAVARGDLKMPRDAELVAIVRKDFAVLWSTTGATKKSGTTAVKAIDELEGHRVGVLGRSESNPALLRVILAASGVDPEKVSIKQFMIDQIDDMARDKSLNAFMAVGPIDSRITSKAIAATARVRGQPKFLAVDVSETIAQKNPVFEAEEIPGSSFNAKPAWPEDKIDTVSVSHIIIARKPLSEAKVAALTKQIFLDRQTFTRELPGAHRLLKPNTDKDAALPVHRGAAAYIDNNEKTFLDGYSDYIWFAVLALSGIGSAYAWLRRYFGKDEWEGMDALSDKITSVTEKARRAGSSREIALLEAEVDELLAEALNYYNEDWLEEQDLSILTLLFQRFHHVASAQRSTLAASPDSESHLKAV